jgi:glycosyltransferase involved in cell wall biosynthesis
MRILMILPRLPGTISDGGDLWAATIIGSLQRNGRDVHLIGYRTSTGESGPQVDAVDFGEFRTRLAPARALFWGLQSLVAGRPYTVQKWRTGRLERILRARLVQGKWDAAIVYGAAMSWTIPLLKGLPFVHVSAEPVDALYASAAQRKRWPLSSIFAREAKLLARAERAMVARAVESWCITQRDADHYRRSGASRLRVLTPLSRPEWAQESFSDVPTHDLVMLGNWVWRPNRIALQDFLSQVVPLLPRSWRIVIGGMLPNGRFDAPDNVSLVGPVIAPCAFLRSGKRIAVPSTSVVGFNTKLLDAIAAGRPVVASKAALDLAGPVPSHVRGADDPASFAAALQDAPTADPEEIRLWMIARRESLDEAVQAGMAHIRRGNE